MNIIRRTYASDWKFNDHKLNQGRSNRQYDFRICFIVDLLMQHKPCSVNLISRSWRTWKMNQTTPTTTIHYCVGHHFRSLEVPLNYATSDHPTLKNQLRPTLRIIQPRVAYTQPFPWCSSSPPYPMCAGPSRIRRVSRAISPFIPSPFPPFFISWSSIALRLGHISLSVHK